MSDLRNPIQADLCNATLTIADSVASGWTGPLDDEIRCELEKGHAGDHQYTARWQGDDRIVELCGVETPHSFKGTEGLIFSLLCTFPRGHAARHSWSNESQ